MEDSLYYDIVTRPLAICAGVVVGVALIGLIAYLFEIA